MKWLYLLLDLGTFFFPAILSFDKNVQFIKSWRNTFISSIIIGIPFVLWDIYFTKQGIWEFNSTYVTGIKIFNLPIEEVLFFLVVPFACIFIYECCKYYFKTFSFNVFNRILFFALLIYVAFLLFIAPSATYTIWVFISSLIVLFLWGVKMKYSFIGISFFLSLIPFSLMNGVLTGAVTEIPVVIYNNMENSKLRLFTIPFEDIMYSFSLIVASIITFELLNHHKEN